MTVYFVRQNTEIQRSSNARVSLLSPSWISSPPRYGHTYLLLNTFSFLLLRSVPLYLRRYYERSKATRVVADDVVLIVVLFGILFRDREGPPVLCTTVVGSRCRIYMIWLGKKTCPFTICSSLSVRKLPLNKVAENSHGHGHSFILVETIGTEQILDAK